MLLVKISFIWQVAQVKKSPANYGVAPQPSCMHHYSVVDLRLFRPESKPLWPPSMTHFVLIKSGSYGRFGGAGGAGGGAAASSSAGASGGAL